VQIGAGLHRALGLCEHAVDEGPKLVELQVRGAVQRFDHSGGDVVLCHVVFRFAVDACVDVRLLDAPALP
jgi:hypothetical protein